MRSKLHQNSLSFKALKRLLDAMRIPVISKLRETQNHIKASEQGSGIHEMGPKIDERDIADWQKIIDWPDTDQQTNALKVVVDNA